MRRNHVARAIVNRRRARRRRRAIPTPRLIAWPAFARLARNLRNGVEWLYAAIAAGCGIFAESASVSARWLWKAAGAVGRRTLAAARAFGRGGGRAIAVFWRSLSAVVAFLWCGLCAVVSFVRRDMSATFTLFKRCLSAAIEFFRRDMVATGRFLRAGFIKVRTAANREVELPRIDLAPLFGVAVALFAVVAISVAGFTAWRVVRSLPDTEETVVVAARDHHPPLYDGTAGQPAPQPAAPVANRAADFVTLASRPDDDIAVPEFRNVPELDDIYAQSWYDDAAVPEPEEELLAALPPPRRFVGRPYITRPPMPSGIPVQPESPDGVAPAQPLWLANAVEHRHHGGGPMIAIVIDDAGVARDRTRRASELPAPLTIAFIPYGEDLETQTRYARSRGHELLLHIPMEPGSPDIDPGHNALLTSLSRDEIMRRFRWALDRFDGYVGVNNHMGSKFMARDDLVGPVLEEIDARGLLFLDSRTDHKTAGTRLAGDMGMPHATRNVFLDNDLDAAKIRAQLAELERVARRRGHAIAIGHPHDVTTEVLAKWIPEARRKGFVLVPVSAIVKREYGPRLAAVSAGGESEGFLGRAQ